METIAAIKTKIRKALKSQGTYTKDLEPCIGMTAGSYYAFMLAERDIERLACSFCVEYSREGKERLVPHPAFKVLKDSQEMTRKSLREIGLTLSTLITDEGDEFDDMMRQVNDVKQ